VNPFCGPFRMSPNHGRQSILFGHAVTSYSDARQRLAVEAERYAKQPERFEPMRTNFNRACDAWMPNLGPSERLLRDFRIGKLTWQNLPVGSALSWPTYLSSSDQFPFSLLASEQTSLRMLRALTRAGPARALVRRSNQRTVIKDAVRRLMKSILSEVPSAVRILRGDRSDRGGSRPMTPTKSYPYTVVDVFTTEPLSGNSLAVFPDASEFDAAAMQKIARELNLTEPPLCFQQRDRTARLACAYLRRRRNCLRGTSHRWHGLCALQKGIVSSSCHEFLLEEEFGPIPAPNEAGTPPLIWFAYTCDSRSSAPGRLTLCDRGCSLLSTASRT